MRVRELLERVGEVAPFSLAADWDNVGLMIGDPDLEVRRLGVALDALPETLDEAADRGCEALLTHHPLFFAPIKSLDLSHGPGRVVRTAVQRGMAVLAAHTNWDSAEGGVSWELARLLGLKGTSVLDPLSGLGVCGTLPEPLPAAEVLARIKRAWGLTWINGYLPKSCSILRVALCGGAGAEFWTAARSVGADLFVTADVKYHTLLDADRGGMPVAVVDHAEMERATLGELARRLAEPGGLETVLIESGGLSSPLRL
ncbi:Nif3-like dinuclear metal center hexameric protein [Fretibacterium sp. OH1220_COT-178]|uniref:Nif3-like dinuclear metal center hexameric protein n=1 Tax=Fretibacterium sp. OH1220_COT-178 TaxID=2491047 RepID=UPI000F5D879F|nr:Nif3-like dinuclear metal center hexameric protein [Fretibacterium sp. OH1220_COT-178]RRD65651.1 Nif3-like dinuclear metal center hexameric protein [Fretibacterium sp. OH1220_COT-178]